MITLHAAAHPLLSLTAAMRAGLDGGALNGGTALLASPSQYRVALLGREGFRTAEGIVDVTEVYEARIFTAEAELRWLRESDGLGRAVLLSEDPAVLASGFPETGIPAIESIGTVATHYLVWGESAEVTGEWTTLASGRIGRLTLPIRTDHRVRLVAQQYLAAEPKHGNTYIAEERLIRLEPYAPLPMDQDEVESA